MPILDMQRRMRELGRIRTGQQVASGNGRKRPTKLEHWRLTSPSRSLIEAVAVIYGGQVKPWEGQWEVVTTSDSLRIIVPPGESLTQWQELWSGGGCQRRCDGRVNVITDTPCACPADPAERRDLAANGQACKPTTRLNVMLPDVPDLGVWRLESHGYYAAVELSGTVDVIAAAGRMIPAVLRLDQREVKRPGQPVNRFAVPVIELSDVRIMDLVELAGGPVRSQIPAAVNKRERVARPALPAGPPPSKAQLTPNAGAGASSPVPASIYEPAAPPPASGNGEVEPTGRAPSLPLPPNEPASEPASTPEAALPARSAASGAATCDGFDIDRGRCRLDAGHTGNHRNKEGESWK